MINSMRVYVRTVTLLCFDYKIKTNQSLYCIFKSQKDHWEERGRGGERETHVHSEGERWATQKGTNVGVREEGKS